MKWVGLRYQGVDYSDKYMVSECGQIKHRAAEKPLKQFVNRGGYNYVCISDPNSQKKRRTIIVHKAVAYSFLEAPMNHKSVVDHLDSNKANNHRKNLEWVEARENTKRALQNGLFCVPTPKRKLSDEQVTQIRLKLLNDDEHWTHKQIADLYGVSRATISQISAGKIHKDS